MGARCGSAELSCGHTALDSGLCRRGLCFVLAAPSGAGKSTIIRALIESEPELAMSVSVTTRLPRPGEAEGVHYYYKSESEFDAMGRHGALLEYARVFGHSYGSPRGPVEAALASGRDVAFDIDWQGWRQLKSALPLDCVGVFVLPPSLEVLEQRLRGRKTDGDSEIARRMEAARSEISHWTEFDHVLVNEDLTACIAAVRSILHAARTTVARAAGLGDRWLGNAGSGTAPR